jgi:hypothetical protein
MEVRRHEEENCKTYNNTGNQLLLQPKQLLPENSMKTLCIFSAENLMHHTQQPARFFFRGSCTCATASLSAINCSL